MYVIFSVNEQKKRMQGFVKDYNDDPYCFETLRKAKKWCKNDPFALAKTRYIFDLTLREIIWEG